MSWKNLYVYRETHFNNQLGDKSKLGHNKILEAIIRKQYAR
jgi:hypothetical protein